MQKVTLTGVNKFNAEITIPELRAAGKTLEVITYTGEPHAFAFVSTPTRTPRPAISRKAFEDVDAFIRKHLTTKPSPIDPSVVQHEPFEKK